MTCGRPPASELFLLPRVEFLLPREGGAVLAVARRRRTFTRGRTEDVVRRGGGAEVRQVSAGPLVFVALQSHQDGVAARQRSGKAFRLLGFRQGLAVVFSWCA